MLRSFLMETEQIQLDPYQPIRVLAKGGMGEVILAYDPLCSRLVACKRIRPDLKERPVMRDRFLKEASLTAQLTHPGIISIYTLHKEEERLFYTMPYVPGETLRERFRKKKQVALNDLLPLFLSLCHTIAYVHSKGILHRDIKPENILVGEFGEVLLLDWGLAREVTEKEENHEGEEPEHVEMTRPGKIVGTLAYMAPERALGAPSSFQTDIYALGVILYQILTLHLPFERKTLKEFAKSYQKERFIPPQEIAPYREIPPRLTRIVKRALHPSPKERYKSVEELIGELQNHLLGRAEWFEVGRLDIHRKSDWEFQENLLLSKHLAVTRTLEGGQWASMMVSKGSFSENIRLTTHLTIGAEGAGVGFLLSIPHAEEREHPFVGYCLWLGTEKGAETRLFRNRVDVLHLPELLLERNRRYALLIEKKGNTLSFSLDGGEPFTYTSYLPLIGTHVGLLAQDANFHLEELVLSAGSEDLTISCLAVPDAFLASKQMKRALAEYRRIAASFAGYAEGREALFRSGITLLEWGRGEPMRKEELFMNALEEFSKLHATASAPLEYLGKGLIYEALGDYAEEVKCYELALRRYPQHPLLQAIEEQILYRMHESAQKERAVAYRLILTLLRTLPQLAEAPPSLRLFRQLLLHWEPLPFLEGPIDPLDRKSFAIPLAFWLADPPALVELFEQIPEEELSLRANVLFALFELGARKEAVELLSPAFGALAPLALELEEAVAAYEKGPREERVGSFLMRLAIRVKKEALVPLIADLIPRPLSKEEQLRMDGHCIWAHLQRGEWEDAGALFEGYPFELLNQESTLLHPLYGCYLAATEGREMAELFLAGVTDTPFPRSWTLLGHEVTHHLLENPAWIRGSFLWERRALYQQLALYAHCLGEERLAATYEQLERTEYVT